MSTKRPHQIHKTERVLIFTTSCIPQTVDAGKKFARENLEMGEVKSWSKEECNVAEETKVRLVPYRLLIIIIKPKNILMSMGFCVWGIRSCMDHMVAYREHTSQRMPKRQSSGIREQKMNVINI